jgi:hypothetical protein
MQNKDGISFERSGEAIVASGKGWTYEKIGTLSCFKQTGKVVSLRQVKVLIKDLIYLSNAGVVCDREK